MRTLFVMIFVAILGVQGLCGDEAFGEENSPVNSKQVYEIRHFVMAEGQSGEEVDRFLTEGLLPALNRTSAKDVGIFAPADGEQSKDRFVIVSYDSISAVAEVANSLWSDEALQEARQKLESAAPANGPYERVKTEILVAMDSMPALQAPAEVGTFESRVYELRVYESVNESMGIRKVEMFNEGEVPIFLDCGIVPVFLGQAIAGPYTPSLTYLTAYPDNQSREQSWVQFRQHPDWKVLSAKARYQGTVSKIHKFVLKPLKGSEF